MSLHPSIRGTLVSSRCLLLKLLRLPRSPRKSQLLVSISCIRRGEKGKAGEGTQCCEREGKCHRGDSLGAAWLGGQGPPKTPPLWQQGRTLHQSAVAELVLAERAGLPACSCEACSRVGRNLCWSVGAAGAPKEEQVHSGAGQGSREPLALARAPALGISRAEWVQAAPTTPKQGCWHFCPRFAHVCGPA